VAHRHSLKVTTEQRQVAITPGGRMQHPRDAR